jgi:hypothetical protein
MIHPARLLLPLFLAAVAGCRSAETPTVYKAGGVVKFTNGSPFRGGIITLTSQADPTLTMSGEIAEDGAFQLATVQNNRRLEGALAGTYSVMVSGRFNAQAGGVAIYQLPQPCIIEPRDNELVIEVDPATKRKT